jgi:hypothetical protein
MNQTGINQSISWIKEKSYIRRKIFLILYKEKVSNTMEIYIFSVRLSYFLILLTLMKSEEGGVEINLNISRIKNMQQY